MAKNKKKNQKPEPSKSEDSVRGKITDIQSKVDQLGGAITGAIGDFTSVLTEIQTSNAKLDENTDLTALNTAEISTILDASYNSLLSIQDNTMLMVREILGMREDKKQAKVDTNEKKEDKSEQLQKSEKAQTANLEKSSEDAKDKQKQLKTQDDDLQEQKKQSKTLEEIKKEMKRGGVLDLILGGAMALAGFISGFVGEYIKVFKSVLAPLVKLFSENKFVVALVESFKTGWTKFATLLSEITTAVLENKVVAKAVELFKAGWGRIAEYFSGLASMVSELFGMVGKTTGFFSKIVSWFSGVGEWLGWFFKFGSKLGSLIGKIAIPLQVIMSIWDTVTGALDGWNKTEGSFLDKLIGAVKGGLTGLLNGLVGGLLDLLKDGLSFVLDFFGFKDAAAWLDSFSFTDVITKGISNVIDSIVGFFKDMVNGPLQIIESIKALVQGKMDWSDFFKNILAGVIRLLLAPVNAMGKLVGFDVTEKALDLLGLPKTGGKAGDSAPASPMVAKASGDTPGDQLAKATNDNTGVKSEKAAQTAAAEAASVVAASNSGGNRSQTVVNNAGPTAVISSSSTKFNQEDMWARGGMAFMGA